MYFNIYLFFPLSVFQEILVTAKNHAASVILLIVESILSNACRFKFCPFAEDTIELSKHKTTAKFSKETKKTKT